MMLKYKILQQTKVAIALGIVFALVFATNMINKNHFSRLHESFASVYEDRLVVESYIYKLSGRLQSKKILFEHINEINIEKVRKANTALNDSINSLISDYENTKLTQKESLVFGNLKKSLNELFILEQKLLVSGTKDQLIKNSIFGQHKKITSSLDQLSEIQLSEGKNLIENSNRIISASNITSKLEIGVIIVVGLIIQGLILASKPVVPKFKQNSRLN